MTPEYLAGLFDGEGSIGIYRVKRANRPESEHSFSVTIANTYKPVMEQICNQFGANLYISDRDCWHVRWTSIKARLILEQLLPYLIIKQEQALIAIEYQLMVEYLGRPIDMFDDREEFCHAIKALKYERWTK